jgi:hypothetical protein
LGYDKAIARLFDAETPGLGSFGARDGAGGAGQIATPQELDLDLRVVEFTVEF